MRPVLFTSDDAWIIEAISNGKDFKVPEGGWDGNTLLKVAGACMYAQLTHEPQGEDEWIGDGQPNWPQIRNNVFAVINFYAQCYDQLVNEPAPPARILAVVAAGGELDFRMLPVEEEL